MSHHSSGGSEQPTSLASLTVELEPLPPSDLANVEQPTSLAKLTVELEPLPASEPPANIEPPPSHLAEWGFSVEPLPPWDKL